MTSQPTSTPVVALEGDPCAVGGRAGRVRLLVALVRCGDTSTMLALDPDVVTVVGHLTWAATSDGDGGEVRDTHVRQDHAQRGVGLVLRDAAQQVAGVRTWSGSAIPDSSVGDTWLESTSATAGQRPVPVVEVPPGALAGAAAAAAEVHVVLFRAGQAVIVALAADTLAWVGHLAWTIDRPGGRLGGEQAGLKVGEVKRVDTRSGFGGRGIARQMYHAAQRVAAGRGWPAEIDHNPDRTAQGDAWAAKVGGWRPELTYNMHMPDYDDLMNRLRGQRPAPE